MRLTFRGYNDVPLLRTYAGQTEVIAKLAAYEDTGYYPHEIKSLEGEWNAMRKVVDSYRKAEDQGLLVRLPCKVGDTIYVIFDGKIWEGEVYHISYSDYYGKITATAWVKQGISAAFEHFGKTVFRTREAAEAALKGEKA